MKSSRQRFETSSKITLIQFLLQPILFRIQFESWESLDWQNLIKCYFPNLFEIGIKKIVGDFISYEWTYAMLFTIIAEKFLQCSSGTAEGYIHFGYFRVGKCPISIIVHQVKNYLKKLAFYQETIEQLKNQFRTLVNAKHF